jgi:hypothetical protein
VERKEANGIQKCKSCGNTHLLGPSKKPVCFNSSKIYGKSRTIGPSPI